mmetsp:Transcript_2158/g.4923  ORF Transcript_2158/g.4923 Transcript_2158/m.4923 type:complete len:228 (+) Transcript_2158:119-802(+)
MLHLRAHRAIVDHVVDGCTRARPATIAARQLIVVHGLDDARRGTFRDTDRCEYARHVHADEEGEEEEDPELVAQHDGAQLVVRDGLHTQTHYRAEDEDSGRDEIDSELVTGLTQPRVCALAEQPYLAQVALMPDAFCNGIALQQVRFAHHAEDEGGSRDRGGPEQDPTEVDCAPAHLLTLHGSARQRPETVPDCHDCSTPSHTLFKGKTRPCCGASCCKQAGWPPGN